MALTGRFLADFTQFHDAVTKAEVELRGMETGAGKVSASLNKMVDSLSGRKLVQDAALAAEAVDRIGGVSKLSAAELQRLGAQANEAIGKLTALGKDVPAGIQRIADAATKAGGATTSLTQHLDAIQQHANAFSGDKIIQQATQIARAVQQIGGASKLTAGEQAQVNKVVTDALGKYEALGKTAPASLRQLAAATKAVSTDMLQMVDSLSGRKLIQDATLAADAVGRIGGVSRLTEDELTRLGAQATEAVAKLRALGKDVPEGIQKIADAAKQAASATAALGTAFSGDKIIEQAKQIEKAVGQIGGASKLTADEQRHVNRVVSEALSKYEALGKTAPASLRQLADATKAVPPATREIIGAYTSLEQHLAQVNALTRKFAGDDVIQQARQYEKAIAGIGGVSKLTATEQREVNRVITDALAKYKALGTEAPKALRDIADQTKQLPQQTRDWTASLAGLASAFGITFSVAAVVAFGRELLATGDELVRVADRTGLATNEVQKLSYIAGQSGNSIEELTGAIGAMQKRMGEQEFMGALDHLHISFEELRKAKPYEQLRLIADGFQSIQDPAHRAQIAADLFGKTGMAILPTLTSEFTKLGDQAPIMSDKTVRSLDAIGDAATRAMANLKAGFANELGKLFNAFDSEEAKYAHSFFSTLGVDTKKAGEDLRDLSAWWDVLRGKMENLPKVELSKGVRDMFGGGTVPKIKLSADDVSGIEADLNKQREALDKASAAAKAHAAAIKALMDQYSGVAAIKAATNALEAVNNNLKAGKTIAEMTREQQHALNDVVKAGIKAYEAAGRTVPSQLRKIYDETFHLRQEMEKLALIKIDPLKQIGKLGTNLQGGTVENQIPLRPRSSLMADMAWPTEIPGIKNWIIQTKEGAKATEDARLAAEKLAAQAAKSAVGLGDMARVLSQLAQVSGGTFSGITQDLATMVAAADTAMTSLQSFSDGTKAFKEGDTLSGIMSMASGIMGIATAAIAAGKAIKNMFFGTAGRDIVKDFAESFNTIAAGSGFDELRAKLGTLGTEGEKLWIALTQGVGRNNPKEAQAAVEAITKALGAFKTPQDEIAAAGFKTIAELQKTADTAKRVYETMQSSGMFSAAAIQEAWEQSQAAQRAAMGQTGAAYDKAISALKAMDDQIKSLSESIANEAPEDVMGIIEQQTRAQIEAIQKQRDEAQLALDATAGDAAAAAEDAAQAIEAVLAGHDFRVKIHFDVDDLPDFTSGGNGRRDDDGFAGGTQGKYLDFGAGRRVTLHGKERIMTEAEGRAESGPPSSDRSTPPVEIHIHTDLDGRQVAEVVTQYIPDVVNRYVGR